MFIISLTYKVPIDMVDSHLDAHVAWLNQGLAEGWLLMAGRKEPRTGGVLIARGERDMVARKAASDPFVIHGVADFELTEFVPSRAAPDFMLESLTS